MNSSIKNCYAKFFEVPMSAIQPKGWLKKYLENQRNGLTGHLEIAGYPFDTAGPVATDTAAAGDGLHQFAVYGLCR